MKIRTLIIFLVLNGFIVLQSGAREYHVAVNGSDDNSGTIELPFKTINAAGKSARAGDTIIVHAGTYREWVNPQFGGTSHLNRIVYMAAQGEEVFIKGSEVVKGWEKVKNGVWKVTLNNKMFGEYNPYKELVAGDWFLDYGKNHHTGEVYLNGKSFFETDSLGKIFDPEPLKGAQDQEGSLFQWYCESNSQTTTIWANFHEFDPNKEMVEINVRPAVFFPSKTGINYITVNGFNMSHAATNWAPPTAEQMGLIGPHWSKGWIIENNIISHSKCSGISLGKDHSTGHNYSSEYRLKNGHICQLETVFNALLKGWSEETVGSHIVRNNAVFNCEQTGICGNMGAIFSQIYGNHIYDIYVKRQWGGFEMGGIKLHVPIDVVIKDNCIHNTFKGIWIDWQAQGIRIKGNLLFNNSWMDLHLEVSHGPHIIDNNFFLSDLNLWNISTGNAFVNNLFAGQICKGGWSERFTPYHYPHSTKIAGMMTTMEGDDRYINNIFIKTPAPTYDIFEQANRPKRKEGTMGFGLAIYDEHPAVLQEIEFPVGEMSKVKLPVRAVGNVFLNGALPHKNGLNEYILNDYDANIKIEKKEDGIYLFWKTGVLNSNNKILHSFDLGKALVPEVLFNNADGSPVVFDSDYFNTKKEEKNNTVGPVSDQSSINKLIKIWPK